jgi:glycerol uptake facilitator-like aquaporin
MRGTNSDSLRYVLAAILGAFAGGLLVAVLTRAVPRMMSDMMAVTMRNMMASAGEGTCDPIDM